MQNIHDELLKDVADSTAKMLNSENGEIALNLVKTLELLSHTEEENIDSDPSVRPRKGWAGIWQPQPSKNGTRFERSSEYIEEWQYWADTQTIAPKNTRKRVVYIGESVARGYFYDPYFCPAQLLEEMLLQGEIGDGVEVIDLARSGLNFEGDLERLIESAQVLEPDAFVIFSGNNRSLPPSFFQKTTDKAMILKQSGLHGLKNLTHAITAVQAKNVVQKLSTMGVPVVPIIPEFNLGDWHNEETGDVPWLPGEKNQQWYNLADIASKALQSGDFATAEIKANELIKLDQGMASLGFNILTKCFRRKGMYQEARNSAQQGRDAHSFWDFASIQTPRCSSFLSNELKNGFIKKNIPFVDSADLFARYLDGDLPDRRIFLDYCHLTSQAIRITMAAVAEKLLPLIGKCNISQADILSSVNASPNNTVEGEARFSAAIHNAHWGQPYDIVRHHCLKAVELAPHITTVLEEYLRIAASRTPNWMCRSTERLFAMKCPAVTKYIKGYGVGSLLDQVLLDAITDVLEVTKNNTNARSSLQEIRNQEYGLTTGKSCNLLAPQFAPSFMDREWAHSNAGGVLQRGYLPIIFFMAHSPKTCFRFVYCGNQPAIVQLTARLEDSTGSLTQILVNGKLLDEFALTTEWKTFQLTIAPIMLSSGINYLEVHWPKNLKSGDRAMECIVEKMEKQVKGSLRPTWLVPTFGAIHSLKAKLVSNAS